MASIRRLKSLQSLKIRSTRPLRSCNEIGIRLNSLPSTLTKICWNCGQTFDWGIFKVLPTHPHLRVLKIEKYPFVLKIEESKSLPHELRVVAGDFPQLQVLKLSRLNIKTWEMEKDAMPNLESLFIYNFFNLEYLPEELLCRYFKLKQLYINRLSRLVIASFSISHVLIFRRLNLKTWS